jgi:hypothetical protein
MIVSQASLADGWPGRSVLAEGRQVAAAAAACGPEPGAGVLGGQRWFYVWNRDPFGECCCWRGTVRAEGVGSRGSCARPGKHPWVVRTDGELAGFVHGAADAVEWEELADRYGPVGGARQVAVVLDGLLLVDLDGERPVRDFARLAGSVPGERILGVSATPRGFHVWLDAPGWDQRALNRWMGQWLGSWHGTEERRAGRRGFLLDVRTGPGRYAIWPGAEGWGPRRWVDPADFGQVLGRLRAGMPGWRLLPGKVAGKAPWAVDTAGEQMAGWIRDNGGSSGCEIDTSGYGFTGEQSEMDAAWAELDRGIARLAGMQAGQGRNNRLNAVAYYSGAKAVLAGHSLETVRARLVEAGEDVGTHGVRATVDSGLSAGLAVLVKQQKQVG